MATSKSIFELVADNMEASLASITRLNGHTNTLQVSRESALGRGPAPTDPNDRYCILVPAEVIHRDGPEPARMSPISADDYDMIFWIDCYGFEPEDSSMTPDAVGNSIASDVITELNEDYQRGTHPDSGRVLALNTKIRFAMPMELQQSQFRGVVLRAEVLVRTAKFNPFSLP